MKPSRLRPKVVIWWGAALAAGGAALVVLVPMVLSVLIGPATPGGQDVEIPVEIVLRVAGSVLPPLGAALIGAGLVMLYIERHLLGHERLELGDREHLARKRTYSKEL